MRFLGIDVHKKHSQICILDEAGNVEYETRVPTTRPDLADVLRGYTPARVVIESSTPSEWVARHLESLGFEVIVADPGFAPMYATRCKKLKTDKRDARALAQACKLGAYKPAHRLSEAQRFVRTQIQVRQTLVGTRTELINSIGATLLYYGYRVPSGAAEYLPKRLQRVELPEELRTLLEPLVSMLEPLNQRIGQLDKELAARAQKQEEARRLQEIPGVGPLTSLMFLAVLDGAHRFDSAHQVMSYLGLVPREYSSGEKQVRGRITKAGNSRLRVLLVQASLTMQRVRKEPTERLCAWTQQLAERRGKNIATVALARRMAGIMWAMLRDGTSYQSQPPPRRPPRRREAPEPSQLAAAS